MSGISVKRLPATAGTPHLLSCPPDLQPYGVDPSQEIAEMLKNLWEYRQNTAATRSQETVEDVGRLFNDF